MPSECPCLAVRNDQLARSALEDEPRQRNPRVRRLARLPRLDVHTEVVGLPQFELHVVGKSSLSEALWAWGAGQRTMRSGGRSRRAPGLHRHPQEEDGAGEGESGRRAKRDRRAPGLPEEPNENTGDQIAETVDRRDGAEAEGALAIHEEVGGRRPLEGLLDANVDARTQEYRDEDDKGTSVQGHGEAYDACQQVPEQQEGAYRLDRSTLQ